MINFLKSLFKKKESECYCPLQIIATREPTEADKHEHGTIWVVVNDERDRLALFYRMQYSVNKTAWLKFIPEIKN